MLNLWAYSKREDSKTLHQGVASMLPKSIYELLPIVYVVSGVIAFIQLSHDFGQAGGIILISAGLLVTYMRFSHRYEVS